MVRVILHELLEDPGDGRGADPLPGMDAAVYPHGGLGAALALAHLGYDHVAALVGLTDGLQGNKVIRVLMINIILVLSWLVLTWR